MAKSNVEGAGYEEHFVGPVETNLEIEKDAFVQVSRIIGDPTAAALRPSVRMVTPETVELDGHSKVPQSNVIHGLEAKNEQCRAVAPMKLPYQPNLVLRQWCAIYLEV